jgi:ATP-dependent DNA helicase RecQ
VITGEKDDYIISYQHDTLPVFGKGLGENERHWTSVIRQGMIAALLEKDIENYGLLKLTPKGVSFLEDPYLIELYKDQDFEKLGQNEVEEEQLQSAQAYDEKLFELLKVERKRVAKSKGLPPYVIFQDPSLEEMATVYPTTKEELSQINGVGMGKVEKLIKLPLQL